ncbi:MAG: tetratricopeptide repeat protein [Planctomycetota bacterium]
MMVRAMMVRAARARDGGPASATLRAFVGVVLACVVAGSSQVLAVPAEPNENPCATVDAEYRDILQRVSLELVFAGAPPELYPPSVRRRASAALAGFVACSAQIGSATERATRHLHAAHVALLAGNLTAARERARLAHETAPSDDTAATLARLLARANDFEEATATLRAELVRRPDSAPVRRELAQVLVATGHTLETVPLYLGYLEQHPNDPLALCDAALEVLVPLSQIDDAIRFVRRAIAPARERPEFAAALEAAVVSLARVLGPMQRPADAIVLLDEVLETHPQLLTARREWVLLLRRFGLPGQAAHAYESAIATNADPTLRLLLATDVYAFDGQLDRALAELDFVYAGGTFDPRFLNDLDRGYAMLAAGFAYAGRLEALIPLYEALLQRTPRFLEVRDALARVHLERQETEAALATYQSHLDREPTDALTRARFTTSILLGLGKLEEAAAQLERVVAEQPQNGVPRVNLAWIRERQGRLPEAVSALREAIEWIPENPGCVEKFVDLLDLSGNHDEANVWRERAQLLSRAYRRLEAR